MKRSKKPMPVWMLILIVVLTIAVVDFVLWALSATFHADLPTPLNVFGYVVSSLGAAFAGFYLSAKVCVKCYNGTTGRA